MKVLRFAVIGLYFCISVMPLAWLAATSVKTRADTISSQAKFVPVIAETPSADWQFPATLASYRQLAHPHTGTQHNFYHYLLNSLIIGLISTLAAVALGTSCAYGFSRFRIAGSRDWLFFILSTRFLPPLAVVVPVLIMYRRFDLPNTHAGLILLYTSFNLSLAVWLMKGFIDDIPRAYEEAALVCKRSGRSSCPTLQQAWPLPPYSA